MRRHLTALVVLTLVAGGGIAGAETYARAMLPLYRAVIAMADPSLELRRLALANSRGEPVFSAELVNDRYVDVGGRLLAPGEIDVTSTTLMAHAIQHALFLFGVALAGAVYVPVAGRRFTLALALAWFFVEVLDVPLVLIGSAWDLVLFGAAPEAHAGDLRVAWMRFVTDGGRVGLALAAGWLAVLAGRAPLRRPRGRRRPDAAQANGRPGPARRVREQTARRPTWK